MSEYVYQHNFSDRNPGEMYNEEKRQQKANKMLSVLKDSFDGKLDDLTVLDVGCSNGMMGNLISGNFDKFFGSDIDQKAVRYAKQNKTQKNIEFSIQDGMDLGYASATFDVVMCAHIYEHVPDSKRLFEEIFRVLKPGGMCYFAAGNRFIFMEAHYKLPLLAAIPKKLAHVYIRIFRDETEYYETHLSIWGLKKLVAKFDIDDYTLRVIKDPEKFYATEMVLPGSVKQKIALFILKIAYWTCPTYIWVLKKPTN